MEELLKKLEEQQEKIDAIYSSVEKMRRYFLWTFIIIVSTIVLPLVILAFVLPSIITTLTSAYGIGGI